MRILVTGSRNLGNRIDVWAALDQARAEHGPFTLVVGDCETGADKHARDWATANGLAPEVHEADWEHCGPRCPQTLTHRRQRRDGSRYCPGAGPRRNAAMVASGADLCLAFPLGRSAGTRGCMRLAAAAGVPVKEHTP